MSDLPESLTLGDLLDAKLVLEALFEANRREPTDTRHYLEGALEVVADYIQRATED